MHARMTLCTPRFITNFLNQFLSRSLAVLTYPGEEVKKNNNKKVGVCRTSCRSLRRANVELNSAVSDYKFLYRLTFLINDRENIVVNVLLVFGTSSRFATE